MFVTELTSRSELLIVDPVAHVPAGDTMKLFHIRQTMNQWLSRGRSHSKIANEDSNEDSPDHRMQMNARPSEESSETTESRVTEPTLGDRRGMNPKVMEWRRRVLIRKGARLHASMLERSDGGSLAMLDSLGMVVCWYEGGKELAAGSEQAVLSQHVSQFYVPTDVATNMPAAHLKHAASAGSSTEPGWRKRSDGSTYWATTVIQSIALQGGPLQGFSHIVRESDALLHAQSRIEAPNVRQPADAGSYGVMGATGAL